MSKEESLRSTIHTGLSAWITRVDDVDYSIITGEHEQKAIDEITQRVLDYYEDLCL